MSTFLDKCYHVACAIPRAQTVIGVSFAIKDLVGIIKDIAMNTLFKDFAKSVTKNIKITKKKDVLLKAMFEQNVEFLRLGLIGNIKKADEVAVEKAVEAMNTTQNTLKSMNLYMPVSDSIHRLCDNENNLSWKTHTFTTELITEATLENNRRLVVLRLTSFFTETVPANKRLYNLATAVISAIPVVGTVYNVGALGYFCFIK